MAFKLSNSDLQALNVTLERILADLGRNETTIADARAAFAHMISAAARGDETELRGWLDPRTIAMWETGFREAAD